MTHTHSAYPATVTLIYDANGRLIVDDMGRSLTYDALGRLREAGGADMTATSYGYDALNRLVTQALGEGESSALYYRDDLLVNELRMKSGERASIIRLGGRCVGVASETASTLALVRADATDSVLLAIDSDSAISALGYPPYGDAPAYDIAGMPMFVGERLDPAMGVYHLGNGYRTYHPRLMRFTSPDSLSPFGAGGMNAYAYCAGDPINHADPTGHMRWQAGVGIFAGALGILFAIVSGGLAIAAEGSFMAAIRAMSKLDLIAGASGIVADATGIASTALEGTNKQASADLAWVSLAFGLAPSSAEFADKASTRISKLKKRSVSDGSARATSVLSSGSVSTIHSDSADSVLQGSASVRSLDSARPSTTGFSSASSDDLEIDSTHRSSSMQQTTAVGPANRSRREARAANSPDMGGHRASSAQPIPGSRFTTAKQDSWGSVQDDGPMDARMPVVGSQAAAQFRPLIHASRASGEHWQEPEIPGIPSS